MRRSVVTLMLLCIGLVGALPAAPAEAAPAQAPERRPVLLVGGTFAAQRALEEYVEPWLLAAGYDEDEVFSRPLATWSGLGPDVIRAIEDYGRTYQTYASGAGTAAMGSVLPPGAERPPMRTETSAHIVAHAVDDILAATGAERVDIIGHSQGAAVARHYVKFYGQDKVATMISLGGVNWGIPKVTDSWLGDVFLDIACDVVGVPVCDQIFYEPPFTTEAMPQFFRDLNSGEPTPGDVDYFHFYTTTEERHRDPSQWGEMFTLPGAVNASVQQLCGDEYLVYHVDEFEHPAMQDMMLAALEGREITSGCEPDWVPRRCEVAGAPYCQGYEAARRAPDGRG